jgi:Cu/Ag efflux pump CusA
VTFNVAGRSLQRVMDEVRSRIDRLVKLPSDMHLEFAGASVAERQAHSELILYSLLAFALIAVILFVCFRWPAHAWLVLLNLPFALIGSIFAIAVSSIGLSLGALVGLITVFGVSARNAILLFSHYEHLVEKEGQAWDVATAVRGAQERLIPILLTASITALGLLPLAVEMDRPGQEISGPMAIAVLGGLISSTVLNLLVLPVIALRFGGPKVPLPS